MSNHYPLHFTLEDGVEVTVNRTGDNTYDFTLTPEEGPQRHFNFVDKKPREEVLETLDFDQINAVRRFWLEQEKAQ